MNPITQQAEVSLSFFHSFKYQINILIPFFFYKYSSLFAIIILKLCIFDILFIKIRSFEMNLLDLPYEILLIILQYIPPHTITKSVSCICKSCKDLSKDNTLWKSHCFNSFPRPYMQLPHDSASSWEDTFKLYKGTSKY